MKRRDFLRLSAATAVAAPSIWIPRLCRAQSDAFGSARHLLILFAQGGLRSHALFNAVGSFQHNPWRAQPGAPETEWRLGAACGSEDIEGPSGTISAFSKITDQVAVIPCVDHTPSGEPEIDHRKASMRIGTGDPDGKNGLLSIIGRHHPIYADGWTAQIAPPVDIGGPSYFSLGSQEATFLDLLGIEHGAHFGEQPIRELFA